MLEVFTDDYAKLFESVVASVKLEMFGFLLGALPGFLTGVALGWSRTFGYWVHPVMRMIGPLPSIAWLPIAFFAFPSSWSANIFARPQAPSMEQREPAFFADFGSSLRAIIQVKAAG